MRKPYAAARALTLPGKGLIRRLSLALLVAASLVLIVLSRSDSEYASNIRTGITDVAAPVLVTLAAPADALADMSLWLQEVSSLYAENQRLKTANASLMQWQTIARGLDAENQKLRALMHVAPMGSASYITARVIGDSNSPYVRSMLIGSGTADGVQKNQVVMSEKGIVGRVVEAGAHSSRVLLMTDINSRLPIITEGSRERGILGGDNSDTPTLRYLPENSQVTIGERIVTTGDGGALPPDLPVGIVTAIENGMPKITPYADWHRLEFVSVVDYKM